MKHRLAAAVSLMAAVAVLGAGVVRGDGAQTGSIGGVVKDEGGGVLPGATVEAKGTTTGFSRSTVSQTDGTYTIRLLPPGDYTVTVQVSGFQKLSSAVSVYTERNTQFNPSLRLTSVAEAISVTAELPLVDKTNVTTGATVNTSFTQKLAIGRSYQSLLQMSPGVTGGANPNVHGSLSSTNVFLFDGVDTTDTATGTFGQNFNYEAIQEIAVNTGAFGAEYGRATGAIVSVVTKSGTNEFHGSGKVLATNDQWDGQNTTKNQVSGATLARTKFDKVQPRYSFTLGGPFLKDRLWFFGAYEFYELTSPATQTQSGAFPAEDYQQTTNAKLWQGKITFQASSSHTLEVTGNGDPIDGFLVDYWGAAAAEREAITGQDQGGNTYRLNWTGIFGNNLSAEFTAATATSRIDVIQFETNATAPSYVVGSQTITTTHKKAAHYNLADSRYYNGATFEGLVERPRTQFNAAATYYAKLFGGGHTIKAGLDYQDLDSESMFAYPDNVVYYDASFNKDTRRFVPEELDVFDPPESSTSKGTIWAVYVQDKMEIGRLFVNAGLRLDKQTGKSDLGSTTFDSTVIAPRLYATWDLLGTGKTIVQGGYGRFYQSLIQSFSDGYAGIPQQTNHDVLLFNPATGKYEFADRIEEGGNSLPINSKLDPTYTDDFNLGVEHQLGRVFKVSLRGTYRTWNDIIDDVKTFQGGVRTVGYVNYDGASRKYRGLELQLDKRYANNWQAFLNYTLGRTEGNHFSNFASQLGDYLDNVTTSAPAGVTGRQINEENLYGLASYDRTHDVKAFGSYSLPLGPVEITAGTTLGWRSGNTYQRTQTSGLLAGARYTQFATPRGSDRFPSQFYWDLALDARVRVWKDFGVAIKGEVFNLTDNQVQVNGSTTNNNTSYGKATSRNQFAAPRTFRLTAKVEF